jgi:hypothetical protein
MVVFKIPVEHNGGNVATARKQCWDRNPGISNLRIQFCTYILSANLFKQYRYHIGIFAMLLNFLAEVGTSDRIPIFRKISDCLKSRVSDKNGRFCLFHNFFGIPVFCEFPRKITRKLRPYCF